MSFHATLHFYRPTQPPVINGPALANFVRNLLATKLFTPLPEGALSSFSLKFGRSIDHDTLGTSNEVPIADTSGVSVVRSIEWDIDHAGLRLEKALSIVAKRDQPIYRAHLALGTLRRDITEALQTTRPGDGTLNLSLETISLQIGPIELSSLTSDESFHVGWISLAFGGNGYLYPWTARDITTRAGSLTAVQPLTNLCRATWPVVSERPKVPLARFRRRMGDLWPSGDLYQPRNWTWGVCETG